MVEMAFWYGIGAGIAINAILFVMNITNPLNIWANQLGSMVAGEKPVITQGMRAWRY